MEAVATCMACLSDCLPVVAIDGGVTTTTYICQGDGCDQLGIRFVSGPFEGRESGAVVTTPTPMAMTHLIGDYLEINLVSRSESGKTFTWSVLDRKHKVDLGVIYWHSSWRQYVFSPIGDTVYSAGCMTEIAQFMERQR